MEIAERAIFVVHDRANCARCQVMCSAKRLLDRAAYPTKLPGTVLHVVSPFVIQVGRLNDRMERAVIQSASSGRFLVLSQGETDFRASSTSKKSTIRHERMLVPINVCILLLMSLSFLLTRISTNAASSPPRVMHPAGHPSHSPSPTVTIKPASSENAVGARETPLIPLTLVDLMGTIVVALIPALIGSIFIVMRLSARRKRRLAEWAGQDFLVQEEEHLDWQGAMEVVDFPAEEPQEEQHREAEDIAFQSLLASTPVASGVTSSRLSRMKCRLRELEEPLSSLEHAHGQES